MDEAILNVLEKQQFDLFLIYLAVVNQSFNDWNEIESRIPSFIRDFEEVVLLKERGNFNDISYFKRNSNFSPKEAEKALKEKVKQRIYANALDIIKKNLKREELTNVLMNELLKFEQLFRQYLDTIEYENKKNKKYKNIKSPISYIVNKCIVHIVSERMTSIYSERIVIISFNYTTYLKEKFPYNMINIHGVEKPIFGIDYTDVDEKYKEFTKTFRVLVSDEVEPSFDHLSDTGISSQIIFFGHSLSKADYSYFQSIFDLYDIYNNPVELIFLYSNYDETRNLKLEQNNLVEKLISAYGSTLDNKAKGRNLLHKLLVEGRIKIKELEKLN